MIRKSFHIALALLFITLNIFSQGNKKEKIEALRVAFITSTLQLTTEESQKFWPLFNEYQDQLKSARKEFKSQPSTFENDPQAIAYLDAELLLKQRELKFYKEFYEKIKKVIPVRKVALLRKAEEDFKKELLKQLQGKSNE